MANFIKVAVTSDIPVGHGKCVAVEAKRIAIFNVDGAYYAIDDVCPHHGALLTEGELNGTTVSCPRHGLEYDVTTGAGLDTGESLEKFEVKVEGSDILVAV